MMISDLLTRRFYRAPDEEGGGADAIVETMEAEEATPAEVATVAEATKGLTEEEVSAWLSERGYTAMTAQAWQAKLQEEASKAKPATEEEDEDEFVQRKHLKGAKEELVTEAERRMTDRYSALDAVKASLDKYPELTPKARQAIFDEYRELPTNVLKAQVSYGKVDQAAKAAMFDLVNSGAVKPKATPAPSAAPAGGAKQSHGFLDTLDEDQRNLIKKNEELYGVKYTEAMAREALGL